MLPYIIYVGHKSEGKQSEERLLTKTNDMKELEKRIFVDEEIILNEYDYTFGEKKSVEVYYSLLNVKTDELTRMYADTYNNVLRHTRERARDGRYKNYEFLISLDLLWTITIVLWTFWSNNVLKGVFLNISKRR